MQIGIVGTGLIGGSVGMSLKTQGYTVFGCDSNPEHIEIALRRNAIDFGASLAEIAALDLVFICVSPSLIVPLSREAYALKGSESVFTDCGSTKTEIALWADSKPDFVPGHPMAGHEKSGPSFATNWLFRGSKWILTPSENTSSRALDLVEEFVKKMDATPVRLKPESHDRQVGILSHLPHVLAGLLIESRKSIPKGDISGGSWKDLTRVAGVDPKLWADIMISNRHELSNVLQDFAKNMNLVQGLLDANDRVGLEKWLKEIAVAKEKQK
jgi:prephenate dehydrogenase